VGAGRQRDDLGHDGVAAFDGVMQRCLDLGRGWDRVVDHGASISLIIQRAGFVYTAVTLVYTEGGRMPIATVSAKGWVVIPKEIRDKYGIKKGDRVSFIDWADVIHLVPIPHDPMAAGFGMFKDSNWTMADFLEDHHSEIEREDEKLRRWGVDPEKLV
jgi:AbrB family looped-hinge helix DNA binding protein